ncbi:MAM and LDL-receptor class A domain-containing protein 1-like [Lytechinus variegatus]|uniref:MAM and LDL-receptor class A domain-containing protein 1-like n=1 Tax=Lytechinus variegatus TaxID=7654 RepID=UPI001BB19103|nr:MAM and LDL-receptor class A domain-containing protein 1-like [Lytechinus variegatus]
MAKFGGRRGLFILLGVALSFSTVLAQFDCSFDVDLCSWTQDDKDYTDWQVGTGQTSTPDTGPSGDHTSGDGKYLYVETSDPFIKSQSVRLISPQDQVQAGGTKCFQFYYHMYGSTTGDLRVYVARASADLPIGNETWIRSGDQGNQWNLGQIDITRPDSDPFDVTIEAYITGTYYGDTAIDDVSISAGFCAGVVVTPAPSAIPSLTECDFENPDICGYWQENVTDDLDWYRNRGPTGSNTGPSNDNTYGTDSGHYMYIESSDRDGDTAQLWSTPFSAQGGHCIEFFYHMWGENMGTLNVYALQTGSDVNSSVPIWSRSGDQGNDWNMARADASGIVGDFQIVFEGIIGEDTSDIAIDDVIVSENTCQEQGDCTFESDMCTWTNEDDTDDFDWIRQQGDTTLGPTFDHTLDSAAGHYIFMNADGQSPGKTARLSSNMYPRHLGTRRCITFWYFLEGVNVGSLLVTQMTNEDGDIDRWLVGSTQGSQWNYGQVAVSQDKDYWVIFEGKVGSSSVGSLAVDDIAIRDNGCRVIPHGAEVGPPLPSTVAPPTTAPPITIPAGPANCDFEGGMCAYTHDSNGDFEWSRRRGVTDTPDTGPDTDHTHQGAIVNAGWYMYTESDFRTNGDTARLISDEFTAVNDSCFTFWYHMYGSDIGTLNVRTSDNRFTWTRTGSQGNNWLPVRMNIDTTIQPITLIFEGVMTGGVRGDIAIDDIQIDDRACNAEYFCDFETGLDGCGFLQHELHDDFDWSVGFGETPTRLTGPYIDHTTGTMTGYYAFIEADNQQPGSRAWLITHKYPGTGVHCVNFYYYMYGDDIGTLSLFYIKENGAFSMTLFSMTGEIGKVWNIARVPIDLSEDFQLVFSASVGDGNLGDIALDDIELKQEACPHPGNIDFEDGFESWTNDPDLLLGQGSTPTFSTGPTTDHTLRTSEGTFAYVESTNTAPGDITRLRSPPLPPTPSEGHCMSFWYNMNGADIGVLRVQLETVDLSANMTLWDYGANVGDVWNPGQVPIIMDSSNYWIVFEMLKGGGDEGDTAIDDITFSEVICGVSPPYADPDSKTTTPRPTTVPATTPGIKYGCNFDIDWCDFAQSTTDDFQWSRTNLLTPTSSTGPESDHTTGDGTGFYVFTEGSFNQRKTAAFTSPTLPASWGGACVDFWYHMWGVHMGTLNVYAEENSTSINLLWTRSGSRARVWYQSRVHYSTLSEFKFVFEGIMGIDLSSDIALDDIYITPGPCPAIHACSFEDADICGYKQDLTDDFDWVWGNGSTTTPYTGPSVDVTLGTDEGHYMYIEASNQNPGTSARLISQRFTPDENTTDICWSFFYHMYGDQMGTLNTWVEGGSIPSWTFTSDGGVADRWYYAEFGVTSQSSYTIAFEGLVGSGSRGDIAIDEVDYKPGPCAFGTCTFEDEFCEWVNVEGDDGDWLVFRGPADVGGITGPNVDHTLGTDQGHYLLVDSDQLYFPGYSALLHLGEPHLRGMQCLRFWYMMNGRNVGELMVYATDGSPLSASHVVWMLSGKQQDDGNTWLNAAVSIDFDAYSDVYIKGMIIESPYGDIAIDDLALEGESCDFYPPEASPDYTFKPLSCDIDH